MLISDRFIYVYFPIANRFATVEMMQQYGILLENFLENGEFVNDCILTMMYHVGGELQQVSALFQPVILKTYSKIWETEYELCDVSCLKGLFRTSKIDSLALIFRFPQIPEGLVRFDILCDDKIYKYTAEASVCTITCCGQSG